MQVYVNSCELVLSKTILNQQVIVFIRYILITPPQFIFFENYDQMLNFIAFTRRFQIK